MNTTAAAATQTQEDIFGPVVYAYTRRQAIADGEQIDISRDAAEAGFVYPVYMTRAAFGAAVEAGGRWIPGDDGHDTLKLPHGQDSAGRIWDVLSVLRFRLRAMQPGADTVKFTVSVYAYDGTHRRRNVWLTAQVGPLDIDDPQPAITIMTDGDL